MSQMLMRLFERDLLFAGIGLGYFACGDLAVAHIQRGTPRSPGNNHVISIFGGMDKVLS